ncbi:MAG TPA: ScyD/ScyE family protein [Thermomicrobiales bacterium]|nr:ScyD/ScyE family protein [Thermomicrobiales bacterium]
MLTGKHILRRLAAVALLASLALAGAATGVAAPACTVIAGGLANPRGVLVADDGSVYVAEGGTGGTEKLPPAPEAGPDQPPATRGLTGKITRIAPDGAKTTVAANLPSFSSGSGPTSLVLAGGFLWVTIGGAGNGMVNVAGYTPLADEAALVKIDPRTGAATKVADLGAYEVAHNPDGVQKDTNPWGLALGPDGTLYATDAGGNDLLRVNPANGQIAVAAVFPGQPGPQPNPARGGQRLTDPVPTGVVAAADGTVDVGLLPGGPPIPGRAKVVAVAPNGTQRDAATGLTYVVFLALGPDQQLYATELLSGTDAAQHALPGRVVRLAADGTSQVAVDNLPFPGGIAFDQAGDLYVATNITTFGPPPAAPQGRLLRCAGVATTAMPGLPNTGRGGGRAPRSPLAPLGLAALLGAGLAGLGLARRRAA